MTHMKKLLILSVTLILLAAPAAMAEMCSDCQCESCDESSMCMPDDLTAATAPLAPSLVAPLDESNALYEIDEIIVEPGAPEETNEAIPPDSPLYLETHSLLI